MQEYDLKLTPATPRYQLSLLYLSSSNDSNHPPPLNEDEPEIGIEMLGAEAKAGMAL
jgi:hypothetical protein